MSIKSIVNYQWKKKVNKTLQEKALKALLYFFILMLCFTLLSRFADSLLIPIVKTETSKAMTITNEVKAEGKIIQNKEEGITVAENIKIAYVNVEAGRSVKSGDTLLEADLTEVNERIKEINEEISDKEKTLSRANEDYNLAVARQDKIVEEALKTFNEANDQVNKYNNASDEEKAQMDRDSIESNYNATKSAYEQAISDRSENLISNNRVLEDAEKSCKTDELKSELTKLQEIVNNEGKIKAPRDGVITKVAITSGEVTTNNAVLYMADKDSGYKFVSTITKEQKKYAKQEQTISLKLSNSDEMVEGITISSITTSEDDDSTFKVSAILPVGVGEVGESATMYLSSKSKKYPLCVPLEALHQEGNDRYYILVVGEEDTILGTEKVAQRVDVTISNKNDTHAALDQGIISSGQKIIVSSNKTIKEGDRVRLEEE